LTCAFAQGRADRPPRGPVAGAGLRRAGPPCATWAAGLRAPGSVGLCSALRRAVGQLAAAGAPFESDALRGPPRTAPQPAGQLHAADPQRGGSLAGKPHGRKLYGELYGELHGREL
jgi:hypothetical protein